MWTYEHSVDTAADPGTVFEILRDVARWPEWNAGVERIDLDGPFATGTTGVMAVPGAGALAFTLSWVGQDAGFEDLTPIPDADVVVRVCHELRPRGGGGTRITYRATVEGAGAASAAAQIGPAVTADFSEVMAALAARAESAHAHS